ncbi:hypothetical protein [Haloferula sp. BvORR071]|uniref:hypothetical protein n=1 Tax=Haloferula sp. BvORR071 TaxID=1396141 RepID=UPI000553CEDB|nr:hypothetical protein [Haloferula sp. BvORR071]
MTLRAFLTLLAGAAISSSACLAQNPAPEKKPLPDTKQELEVYLVGTSWIADADGTRAHVFRKDPKAKRQLFEGKKLKPTYVVTGRRTLTVTWAPKTIINCVVTEDCSKMSEINGEKHTWVRQ